MKNDLFDQLEEEEDDSSSEVRFSDNFENLNYDIIYIDKKIQSINGHISILENKLQMVQQNIQNAQKNNQTSDISKLYAALNKMYELLSLFQKSEQVYLDLKFKYRGEQNDLRFKLIKLDEVDKKRIEEADGINNSDIISALSNLMKDASGKNETIKELENDPKYTI